MQDKDEEKSESLNSPVNNVSNDLSESDSSDDDIIIDRTEETSINANQQASEHSKMDTDAVQDTDDRKFLISLYFVPYVQSKFCFQFQRDP